MAARTLSRDELAFGRAILLATDSLGMSAEGAFWLFDDDENAWHYFLITSLFNRLGPRETYLQLNKCLQKKLSEHELQEFTIFIADPSWHIAQGVRAYAETSPHISDPQEIQVRLNGHATKAFVYRMARSLNPAEMTRARKRFNKTCKELVTA